MTASRYVILPGVRELARIVAAIALAAVLGAGASLLWHTRGDAELRQRLDAQAETTKVAKQHAAEQKAIAVARDLERSIAVARAETLEARYAVAKRRSDSSHAALQFAPAPADATPIAVASCFPSSSEEAKSEMPCPDTTARVLVIRQNDPQPYPIPQFVADAYLALVATATLADQSLEAERAARWLADSTAADWRATSDSLAAVIASQANEIELRDAEKKKPPPRCGAKCGAALTVGGLIVVKLAASALEALTGGK